MWFDAHRRVMQRLVQVLAAVAIAALLLPLLTPAAPALAAWTPEHDHIFAGGREVPHSHPWEPGASAPSTAPLPHICLLHPADAAAPADVADLATANGAAEATPSDARSQAQAQAQVEDVSAEVVFLFDPDVTGSILPAPGPAATTCAGFVTVSRLGAARGLSSLVTPPEAPPPRSLSYLAA
ncbi:MAG: hypothetical protein IT429_03265 [Gemmataceae bacterium]|nr:hypothetical protein [Gemmataceae bacterium]